jgi:hypothetical protein
VTTNREPASTKSLPPDPEAYDSPRNARARAKGLEGPYIAGGTDPDPEKGLVEERHYVRLLVWMVVVLILGGFILGFFFAMATGTLYGNFTL